MASNKYLMTWARINILPLKFDMSKDKKNCHLEIEYLCNVFSYFKALPGNKRTNKTWNTLGIYFFSHALTFHAFKTLKKYVFNINEIIATPYYHIKGQTTLLLNCWKPAWRSSLVKPNSRRSGSQSKICKYMETKLKKWTSFIILAAW